MAMEQEILIKIDELAQGEDRQKIIDLYRERSLKDRVLDFMDILTVWALEIALEHLDRIPIRLTRESQAIYRKKGKKTYVLHLVCQEGVMLSCSQFNKDLWVGNHQLSRLDPDLEKKAKDAMRATIQKCMKNCETCSPIDRIAEMIEEKK